MRQNKFVLVVVVVIIIVFGISWWLSRNTERIVEVAMVQDDAYELSFDYLSGVDGYELITSHTSDDVLQSYVLVEKETLQDFQTSDSEIAPPTMSIFIFNSPEVEADIDEERPGRITRLQNWAQTNSSLTSFNEIYGAPDVVEVDGVSALSYTTDGVYQQEIFLVSYQGLIYLFVGQHERPTDFIKADFEQLMQSVRLE